MITFTEQNPTVQQYQYLTRKVGWGTEQDMLITEAFQHTLYTVCAFDDDQIIGCARLIGDKTLFLYIQDVMVIPEFQGKKIGSQLMQFILKEVARLKSVSPNLRIYLGASKNKENFYRKFGFVPRQEADLGAGMILVNEI